VVSTAQMTRQEEGPAIRLRRAPRCDPPFDDERRTETWSSPDQLSFDLVRLMAGRRRDAAQRAASSSPSPSRPPNSAPPPTGVHSAQCAPGVSPDARLAVRRFISSCVEVLNGYRPAAHLRRLAQPREAATVVAQGVTAAHRVAQERRRPGPGTPPRLRRPAPVAVVKVSLCEPRPGAVEAAAVLMIGDRTWAMAIRLELHGDAWLATVMRLL